MFWFIIHDIFTELPKSQRQQFFQPTQCHQNISKPQCSLSPGMIFEWPQFPKLRLLRCPKFCPNFLPFVSLGSACGLPRTAAPEAKHHCTWQPTKATIPWSSGSSRRRRPWMPRTKAAVASEEDLGGKGHEALGSF